MKKWALTCTTSFVLLTSSVQAETPVDTLLQSYQSAGATHFSAEAGKTLWFKSFPGKDGQRSCTTCHGENLTQAGKHATTGKTIQAMAPSVNKKRLMQVKKMNKWFKRNCKWTLGRECTAQEKGDLLSFLRTQ